MAGGRIAAQGARSSLQVVMEPEAARTLARRFIEAGADMIKVHRGPPAAVYEAAAEEAHRANLPLVAQPLGPTVYAREAVLAGADILEHAAGVGYSIARDPGQWKDWGSIEPHSLDPTIYADMDEQKAADFIQLLIARHVYLEPDFVCHGRGMMTKRSEYELNDYGLLSDAALRHLPPRHRIKWLRNYVEFDDMEPAAYERRRTGLRNMMRFISQFAKAGGKVMAGTDTPGWAVPGVSMHYEMELLVEAGLTPMQALMAATRNVAEGYRVLDQLGTIEPGKLADLVILRADPLASISNSRRIHAVVKDGRLRDAVLDRSFQPRFAGREQVAGLTWYNALAKQMMNYDPQWAFGWPPPGIESISPTVVTAGSDVTLVVKGVNFVKPSLVYVDGRVVPTRLVSQTELHAVVGTDLIPHAGSYAVVVNNPEPRQRPEWGRVPRTSRT
jgi:hypothetical protein